MSENLSRVNVLILQYTEKKWILLYKNEENLAIIANNVKP